MDCDFINKIIRKIIQNIVLRDLILSFNEHLNQEIESLSNKPQNIMTTALKSPHNDIKNLGLLYGGFSHLAATIRSI